MKPASPIFNEEARKMGSFEHEQALNPGVNEKKKSPREIWEKPWWGSACIICRSCAAEAQNPPSVPMHPVVSTSAPCIADTKKLGKRYLLTLSAERIGPLIGTVIGTVIGTQFRIMRVGSSQQSQ
jgi:hypothetical protein